MAWNPEGWQPEGWQPPNWQPSADEDAERIVIGVNSGFIALKDPDADLLLTFDWSDVLSDGVTLSLVANSIPLPLTLANEATESSEAISRVDVVGGVHAGMYTLTLVATLSDATMITRKWPIRVFNS